MRETITKVSTQSVQAAKVAVPVSAHPIALGAAVTAVLNCQARVGDVSNIEERIRDIQVGADAYWSCWAVRYVMITCGYIMITVFCNRISCPN